MNINPGFLLVEAMIVVVLIGFMMFLVSANSSFLSRALVRAELEKLEAVCHYLQQCAISKGVEQTLTFDLEKQSYQYQATHEILPSSVLFNVLPSVLGPPSSPSHALVKPITFTKNTIVFFPDGIIKSGTVYITNQKKECLYALSSPISQVSYLRKYQYTNGKWCAI